MHDILQQFTANHARHIGHDRLYVTVPRKSVSICATYGTVTYSIQFSAEYNQK
jgi:hypothetical protein